MTHGKLVVAILLALSAAGCSNSKPDERKEAPATKTTGETPYVDPTKPVEKPAEKPVEPAPPAGSAAGSATTMAPPAPGADLPKECQDYKAMVDKMTTCEKFGPQKAKLADAFTASWTAWEKLPADGKAKLAEECKKSAATIQSVGAAACNWK